MKQMYDVFLRDGVSVGALAEIKGSFGIRTVWDW